MADQPARTDVKDTATDPYQGYEELRRQCPVAHVKQPNGLEMYLVTRYEDAHEALADPRLAKDAKHGVAAMVASGAPLPKPGAPNLANHMLASDPPEHTRLRRLVSREFTARRVEQMRGRVQEITDGLLDALVAKVAAGTEVVDLLTDFAFPLPMTVISELLGVPAVDRDRFRAWSRTILLPLGTPGQTEGLAELTGYLTDLIQAKRENPSDDLFSDLVRANEEDRLSDAELVGTAILMVIAGHDTTVNLIANGTLALLRHPDQLALLREKPELLPGAVEEFLRYDAPLERATPRWALEDMEIGGVTVPKGGFVSIVLGSANRDGDAFEDADTLDITRAGDSRHLAFGHGIHFCLGAPLARMEGQLAIGGLLDRTASLELAVDESELTWRQSIVMRGLESLPVRVTLA
ncbi:cytochrome P450 [Kitasatospora sp. NPDC059408]|uniref:cytochrome P450 family protein n=1 Tax=Kitasatospora sp. NPDC059408 TaxID=3346823 RepID=UPI00369336FD